MIIIRNKIIIAVIIVFFVFGSIPIANGQADANAESLQQQSNILAKVVSEISSLYKLIRLEKNRMLNYIRAGNNTKGLDNHILLLNLLISEMNALQELVSQCKKGTEVQLNIDVINQHTLVLDMIMRELEALNELIVAGAGITTIQCETGRTINLIFTGSNIDKSKDISYTIKYDPAMLEVIDLCGITAEIDMPDPQTGILELPELGITITSHDSISGKICFTVSKRVVSQKAWSGVLNNIKFKCKQNGSTDIKTITE